LCGHRTNRHDLLQQKEEKIFSNHTHHRRKVRACLSATDVLWLIHLTVALGKLLPMTYWLAAKALIMGYSRVGG